MVRAASCCVGRAPRNIGVGEILRCAQKWGAGCVRALGRHYGGLREAKSTHICAEKSLHWNSAGFSFDGTLNRGEGRDFVFATGRGGSRAAFFVFRVWCWRR